MRRGLGAFIAIGLIWGFVCNPSESFATRGSWHRTYEMKPVMEPYPTGPGPMKLKLIISLDSLYPLTPKNCDQVSIVLADRVNLNYTGPDSMSSKISKEHPAVFEMDIILPAHGTSGFYFYMVGCNDRILDACYWVIREKDVYFQRGNPGGNPSTMDAAQKVKCDSTFVKQELWGKEHPNGIHVYVNLYGDTITSDSMGARIAKEREGQPLPDPNKPYDSTMIGVLTDSGLIMVKKSEFEAGRDREMEKKEVLEKEPLRKMDKQEIFVKGQLWVRSRGEYKFHQEKKYVNDPSERIHYYDSIAQEYTRQSHDVVLDLRDSSNYNYARTLLDKLVPMERPGYYRTTATGATLKKLRGHGIRDDEYPKYPEIPPPPPNRRDTPPPKTSLEQKNNLAPSGEDFLCVARIKSLQISS